MPAIGVAQEPGLVVIFGKEEGSVGARNRIFEKELVDGLQKTAGLIGGDGRAAAEGCLQVGHQQSRGDALSRHVADYDSKPAAAYFEEIVVVAANLAGLDAQARVFEGGEGWER